MSRLTYTADMAIEQTETHPHAPDEHYCEHPGCSEWGGFGMARSRGRARALVVLGALSVQGAGIGPHRWSLAERVSRPISSIGGGHGHSGTQIKRA